MALSKEEILKKWEDAEDPAIHNAPVITERYYIEKTVLKAMEEYAHQYAIQFDYWRSENFKQVMPNGYEHRIPDETKNFQRRYTRHELYLQYQKTKSC